MIYPFHQHGQFDPSQWYQSFWQRAGPWVNTPYGQATGIGNTMTFGGSIGPGPALDARSELPGGSTPTQPGGATGGPAAGPGGGPMPNVTPMPTHSTPYQPRRSSRDQSSPITQFFRSQMNYGR